MACGYVHVFQLTVGISLYVHIVQNWYLFGMTEQLWAADLIIWEKFAIESRYRNINWTSASYLFISKYDLELFLTNNAIYRLNKRNCSRTMIA